MRQVQDAPLAVDLFCGLGGFTEGFLAEGYRVQGYDIEAHEYGEHRYPAQLVLADVMTLHGSQFKDAAVIVASPPCQGYSYRAMPWKKAKALPPPDNSLFEACFRIQREACEAAGRHIPMIVENVRGAQKWVGRARWNFGSYYLWGDIPALMPATIAAQKFNPDGTKNGTGSWFKIADSKNRGSSGRKHDGSGWTEKGSLASHNRLVSNQSVSLVESGTKIGGDWFSDPNSTCRRHSSKSLARKQASAMIAKIPLPLSQHIARTFYPR